MKKPLTIAALFVLLGFGRSLPAQVVLSIDINDRDQPATTLLGFEAFVSGTADGAGIQTTATTHTYGDITVTISGAGSEPGYDDRYRSTVVDSGEFTEALLLQDFIFSRAQTDPESGLDITVDGLLPNQAYKATIWSYDILSTGNRIADWYANGSLLQDNYIFDGSLQPTNNSQYRFQINATSSDTGQLLIQGRRVAGTFGVFLNALQLEVTTPDPPMIVRQPESIEAYAGERASFSAGVEGTAPFSYQWLKNGSEIAGATNESLILTNIQAGDEGLYSVLITNVVGGDISAEAQLTVIPVEDLATALVSYWPLDTVSDTTPDVTTNMNHLTATNITEANLVVGRRGNALAFNGANTLLYREHTDSVGLPISSHPSYTVALWVRGSYSNQLDRRIFSESSNTNQSPLLNIGTDYQGSNAVVDIYIRNDNGTAPVSHRRSEILAFDDEWHHIAFVDDRGAARLYVDGVRDETDFNYVRGELTPTITSVGGIVRTNASHWFAGTIDDVAVWGRALTEEEVQLVVASGPLPVVPPTVSKIEVTPFNVILTFSSPTPGAMLRIEETGDLAEPAWSTVADVFLSAPNEGVYTATFPSPGTVQKFYRIVRQ